MPDESSTSGSVVITANQMWEKLNSIDKSVGDMSNKIDSIADHEKRLRELEQWRWKLYGGVAVVAILVSVIVTLAAKTIWGM